MVNTKHLKIPSYKRSLRPKAKEKIFFPLFLGQIYNCELRCSQEDWDILLNHSKMNDQWQKMFCFIIMPTSQLGSVEALEPQLSSVPITPWLSGSIFARRHWLWGLSAGVHVFTCCEHVLLGNWAGFIPLWLQAGICKNIWYWGKS